MARIQAMVRLPEPLIDDARNRWPEITAGMSDARIIRFAFGKSLGMTDTEAVKLTLDTRIGTKRQLQTE